MYQGLDLYPANKSVMYQDLDLYPANKTLMDLYPDPKTVMYRDKDLYPVKNNVCIKILIFIFLIRLYQPGSGSVSDKEDCHV